MMTEIIEKTKLIKVMDMIESIRYSKSITLIILSDLINLTILKAMKKFIVFMYLKKLTASIKLRITTPLTELREKSVFMTLMYFVKVMATSMVNLSETFQLTHKAEGNEACRDNHAFGEAGSYRRYWSI